MNGDPPDRSCPAVVLHAQFALLSLALAGCCLYFLFRWQLAGPFWPPALPQPYVWLMIATLVSGVLAFGWVAVEVGRTTAARVGHRWGRESRIIQIDTRRVGILTGVGELFGSLCALIPLSAPGCGLSCYLVCIGASAFSASAGVVTFVCVWTRHRQKRDDWRDQGA